MSISPISYRGKYITPSPEVSIKKSFIRNGSQEKLGVLYNVQCQGVLSASRGSPNSQEVFTTTGIDPSAESVATDEGLSVILKKQQGLEDLFSVDGGKFHIQSNNGTSSGIHFFPRVAALNYDPGPWWQICNYQIEMEADQIYGLSGVINDIAFADYVQSAEENWEVGQGEILGSYTLTHSLRAQGKTVYTSSGTYTAYQNAKNFVVNQLKLDYTTSSLFSPLTGQDYVSLSKASISGLTPYNYARTENNDEGAGSYEVVETWILATGTYLETYNVATEAFYENENRTAAATINGTVIGLSQGLHNFSARYGNAQSGWNIIKGQLYGRLGTYVGTTLQTEPLALTTDHDQIAGRISYNAQYDNRVTGTSGVRDNYTIEKKMSLDDYRTTVSVNGTVAGRGSGLLAERLDKAEYVYSLLKNGLIYNRAMQYARVSGLQETPLSVSVSTDVNGGSINYTWEFSNRDPNSVTEEYSVDKRYSRDDGLTTVDIQGRIIGLATQIYDDHATPTGVRTNKFDNALSYFNSVSGLLYTRARTDGSDLINELPVVSVVGKNRLAGEISYNYSFNSSPLPLFSGALNEIFQITYTSPGQVFAVLPIPGRGDFGPITQDIATKTPRQQTISLELLMPIPTGATYLDRINSKPDPWPVISGVKPDESVAFYSEPVETWNINNGKYSFNQSYLYKS